MSKLEDGVEFDANVPPSPFQTLPPLRRQYLIHCASGSSFRLMGRKGSESPTVSAFL